MDQSQTDGEGGHERSGPRFDPVAGMWAMADIQAEGLRAAGELLERILGSEPDGHGPRSRSTSSGYMGLVDAWTDLLRRTVSGLAQPVQQDAVTVAVDTNGVGPPVRLAVRESTNPRDAVTEVWLHNGTSSDVGPLTLSCGKPSDAGGTALEGAEVRFEPYEISLLPARSSRAVVVSLAANGSLRPGLYRGTIQADGAPMLWLPLEVEVDPC
jgi:hypothetical protein